jgi:hypothetical protein
LHLGPDDGIVVVRWKIDGFCGAEFPNDDTDPRAAKRPRTMTTAEYLRTPESLLPTELAYGLLRVADSPTPRHQSAVKGFC